MTNADMVSPSTPLLEVRSLGKAYGGVQALHDVSLRIQGGEVHGLCGENGAGKSTLIKILTGNVAPDSGTVHFRGQPLPFGNVQASERAGIAVLHQESTAFPDLNAIDNIFVGREITRFRGCLNDRGAMRERTRQLLERLGESLPLQVPVGMLSLAQRQMVAMARALLQDCRLLIMDEPTASLSARETRTLLQLVQQLRQQGIAVLYVSHRLDELFEIAERVTVLRDGRSIISDSLSRFDKRQLIERMIGRESIVADRVATERSSTQDVVLEVSNLTRRGVFEAISFQLRAGEVLGLAGLVGAGRSEIARAIFGIDAFDEGQILVNGKPLPAVSPRSAIAEGLAFVPEDRQHEGLILPMTVEENLSLATLPRLTKWGMIDRRRESTLAMSHLQQLSIRAAGCHVQAASLSGGNQQKLLLGRWLATNPRVLLLDEPTRGVDVGAKAQIHALIRHQAESGLAVLVISSELPELFAICDRMLVIRQGRCVGERTTSMTTPGEILALALPDSPQGRNE